MPLGLPLKVQPAYPLPSIHSTCPGTRTFLARSLAQVQHAITTSEHSEIDYAAAVRFGRRL